MDGVQESLKDKAGPCCKTLNCMTTGSRPNFRKFPWVQKVLFVGSLDTKDSRMTKQISELLQSRFVESGVSYQNTFTRPVGFGTNDPSIHTEHILVQLLVHSRACCHSPSGITTCLHPDNGIVNSSSEQTNPPRSETIEYRASRNRIPYLTGEQEGQDLRNVICTSHKLKFYNPFHLEGRFSPILTDMFYWS